MKITLNHEEEDQLMYEIMQRLTPDVVEEIARGTASKRKHFLDRLKEWIKQEIGREMAEYREMSERLEKWRPIFVKLALRFPDLAPDLNIALGIPDMIKQKKEIL